MTTNLSPDKRKELILAAALKLAVRHGYTNLTRAQVSEAAGVSHALLSHHFGAMPDFRKALMKYAIDQQNAVVVGQGLLVRDKIARKAPAELLQRIASTLLV